MVKVLFMQQQLIRVVFGLQKDGVFKVVSVGKWRFIDNAIRMLIISPSKIVVLEKFVVLLQIEGRGVVRIVEDVIAILHICIDVTLFGVKGNEGLIVMRFHFLNRILFGLLL